MITFHAIVRPFEGEFDRIQRNAIGSWLRLRPLAEVLLYGRDEVGALGYADETGLPLYPLKRNHRGIPLVAWPIEHAATVAQHGIRCLVNADIVLMDDFSTAVSLVEARFPEFLFITQRWGIPPDFQIDFGADWQMALLRDLRKRGKAKHRSAVDYFCYRGDWLRDVPPFAVGRTSWDNWIIWKALDQGIPVIDGTLFTVCIHQDHAKKRVSTETDENRAILTDDIGGFVVATLDNATWLLMPDGTFCETNAVMPKARRER